MVCEIKSWDEYDRNDELAAKKRWLRTHVQLSLRLLVSSLDLSLLRHQLSSVSIVLSLQLSLLSSVLLLVMLRSLGSSSSDGFGESGSVRSLEFLDCRRVLFFSLLEDLGDQRLMRRAREEVDSVRG